MISEQKKEFWMRQALNLAERGLGQVAPNPAVGCVIVKEGAVVGRGWTQKGGRPHAETEALRRAGQAAQGADVYVTLEPCPHQGETASCTQALIQAGIKSLVCALTDPDQRVQGKGLKQLREAGIEIEEDVLADEAAFLNAGYLLHRRSGRPLVTLKVAASLDGRIATSTRHSRWISAELARKQSHRLRATHDGIMIGSYTSLSDNPMLTCRLPGLLEQTAVRIVADGYLAIDLASHLVQSARVYPLWIFCRADASKDRRLALQESGARLFDITVDRQSGLLDIASVLDVLAKQGITRLLIEGGSRFSGSFLRSGFVDRIYWFSAPIVIGADGIPSVAGMGFEHLDEVPHFRTLWTQNLGDDRLALLERVRSNHVHWNH